MRALEHRASVDSSAPRSPGHPGWVVACQLLACLLVACPLVACNGTQARSRSGRPEALRPLRPDTLEANGSERDSDLLHVELELDVDFPGRAVRGTVRHELAALVDGTRTVRVHGVGLEIESCTDGAGRALRYSVEEPLITIELERELARGERATIEIGYSARPEKGLYFRTSSKHFDGPAPQVWSQGQEEDNRYWIPIWDLPNERATYAARITVGEGMTALSNGELVDVTEVADGGRRTYHWRLEQSIPTYLIALAAGRWEHYTDSAGDVPLDYWVAPGTGEQRALRAFSETPAILEYFAELLDEPYPYARYAQVAVDGFLYAGMENASLTLLSDHIVGDAGEIADLDGDPRLLLAHEAAHQWFGDLVTCLGWSHLWLNEAWASYLELCFEGHAAGEESKRLWLERYREVYLLRGEGTRLPLAESWRVQATEVRTHHEYDKGPWVIYMIHSALGDQAFWQGTRDYLDRHREGLVTTADFQRALFDSTGRNIEGLVEQWVEGAGHPRYRVRCNLPTARSGRGPLKLEVRQVQKTDELVPLFDMPVAVDLVLAGGRRVRHVLRVARQSEVFELPLEGPLVDIVFDAECAVLCEIDFAKGREMWMQQAEDPTHAGLRWRALRALAPLAYGHEGRPVRELFARTLTDDPQPILRWLAAGLCNYSDLRAALLIALATDPDARVRLAAAATISVLALDGPTIDVLRERHAAETSPAVRAMLGAILGLPAGPERPSAGGAGDAGDASDAGTLDEAA